MNTKKIYLLIATMALSISTFNASASGMYPGDVLDEIHEAKTSSLVKHLSQSRVSYVYMDAAGGKLLGAAENKFVVRAGPKNTVVGKTAGRVNLYFKPAEAKCIKEFSLTLSVGNAIPFSLNPSCDKLLKDGITRSLSYTILEIKPVFPELTLGPFGIIKINVDLEAVLKVGADFKAGMKVGKFSGANKPIYVDGKRAPDYIYASVRPYINGGARVDANAYLNLLLVSVNANVQGALTLVNLETKAELKGGVSYKSDGSGKFQYFASINVTASAKGGYGSVDLYIHAKILGFITVFWQESNLITIKPILEFNTTIFDRVVYF